MPTKSDAFVVGFRKWLNKYAGGQVDWRGRFTSALPPTPPREQLMDRLKEIVAFLHHYYLSPVMHHYTRVSKINKTEKLFEFHNADKAFIH